MRAKNENFSSPKYAATTKQVLRSYPNGLGRVRDREDGLRQERLGLEAERRHRVQLPRWQLETLATTS